MRNRLKKCVLFAVSLSMLLSLSLTASASEAKPLESEKITVYNGDGQYIGEFDSMEEFESEFLKIGDGIAISRRRKGQKEDVLLERKQ